MVFSGIARVLGTLTRREEMVACDLLGHNFAAAISGWAICVRCGKVM